MDARTSGRERCPSPKKLTRGAKKRTWSETSSLDTARMYWRTKSCKELSWAFGLLSAWASAVCPTDLASDEAGGEAAVFDAGLVEAESSLRSVVAAVSVELGALLFWA